MKKIVIAGYGIEAREETYSEPAQVIMHKLGTDVRSWLTPTEARALSGAIVEAAEAAEVVA